MATVERITHRVVSPFGLATLCLANGMLRMGAPPPSPKVIRITFPVDDMDTFIKSHHYCHYRHHLRYRYSWRQHLSGSRRPLWWLDFWFLCLCRCINFWSLLVSWTRSLKLMNWIWCRILRHICWTSSITRRVWNSTRKTMTAFLQSFPQRARQLK